MWVPQVGRSVVARRFGHGCCPAALSALTVACAGLAVLGGAAELPSTPALRAGLAPGTAVEAAFELLPCCFRTPVAHLLGRKEIFSQPPSPADAHGPRRPTHTPDRASGEPGRALPGDLGIRWAKGRFRGMSISPGRVPPPPILTPD